MGFWDRLLGAGEASSYQPAQVVQPDPYEPFISTAGIPIMDPGTPLEFYIDGARSDIDKFYRSQPNLRKVVDFAARNLAGVPLHVYERVGDTDRRRVRDGDLATVMSAPRRGVGPYRFWHAVHSDGLLYDRWAALVSFDSTTGAPQLIQLPSWRLRFKTDPLRRVVEIKYWTGDAIGGARDPWMDVPLDQVIYDYGYAPRTAGLSPVATLRDVLDENAEAVKYRRELWANGVRVPGYVSRPAGAAWDEVKRSRFVEALGAAYGRFGPKAGGLPLLEDGMEIRGVDIFTPKDAMDIEGRNLSAIEVAAAYHIAPELVGAREGNFSNVDAYRQMLWGPSLGPYLDALEDVLNAQLVPLLAPGSRLYVEANLDAKLRGSFVEQAQITSSSTGAPWLTRNEARAMRNLPPIDGADELVTPLNVLVGGQASPRDSGSQNRNAAPLPSTKARAGARYEKRATDVVASFFARQERVVRGALGRKSPDWWDGERWDRELADDLRRLSGLVIPAVARATLSRAGLDPDSFDESRTAAWQKAVAERSAKAINATTQERLATALDADGDEQLDAVFEAQSSRAAQIATSTVTALSGFASVEAAQQLAPRQTVKTWVTGANPRPEHAAMDGETVALSENFSNGAAWPGDGSALGAEDLAGCNCELQITVA